MRDYRAARAMIWLMAVLGWLMVAAALALPVALVFYAPTMPDLITLAGAAAGGVMAGLVLVALAQIVAAQVDTARNTAEMVALLRRSRPAADTAPETAAPPPLRLMQGSGGRQEPPLTRG